ncbi:hypothetical protein J3Q64DRAFT_1719257 [Phycomyces blakesleeanus]|uniref:Helitron helicase-like domain-containing protein n=1 Tax=Phycomyces blakesleeanus TaxID=4837 RepID=A0ABR3BAD2_PHYBL
MIFLPNELYKSQETIDISRTLFIALACQTFGRFKREFLNDLYSKITQHISATKERSDITSQTYGAAPKIAETNSGEVLMLGNNLPGGLMTINKSTNSDEVKIYMRMTVFMQSNYTFQ